MKTGMVALCAFFISTFCLAAGTNDQKAASLINKLDSIVFPSLEFNEANLNDVVPYLSGASRGLDPAKEGVNIVLEARDNEVGINMDAKNISLHKALKVIVAQAGLLLEFEGGAVILRRPKERK